MTREIIEDFRFIVIPYMVNRFKEINYEGQGGSDAMEFMSNFNEICDLAIKALEQEPTAKNDLEVDCISRENALDCVNWGYSFSDIYKKINELPSVTPQEPQTFKWCDTCKEYDQEKHCCHRFSKVIRDTVGEMKQEYIEREVLDKISAEIRAYSFYVMPQYGITIREADVLHIIDKYKAEAQKADAKQWLESRGYTTDME